ncbi:hypothetical protein SAMN05892883_3765 [Jatrophihabitans sp. GAS493]|uniref:DUF6081 family protein n=1 Tax=Jatrophihabitans sp. GAS493 TaxID=1907575 RepID=UPI000BB826A4|nr:DUF6081 family protein [Jatrophihabitans sp. GAS493]SOD74579.1 hypothetical protein SAMN05892883_3765 [Jatrophihabitans sp. GAS493]
MQPSLRPAHPRQSSPSRFLRRGAVATLASVLLAAALTAVPASSASAASLVSLVSYDSTSLAQYNTKWSNIYGPLDNATQSVSSKGVFTASDAPFKTGVDYSVFDHLKYMAVSNETFPVPKTGTVTFSVDIKASTPGAVAGHVVHGQYGPPGSYDPGNLSAKPYQASVLEGQQAGVVLNMIDFCSGQLFDWFISSNYAFPLIERLPTSITNNTTSPNCPGATTVGLDKAYTQIIKNIPIRAGVSHNVAITYGQIGSLNSVTYSLDGIPVAIVTNVGVPLDKQHAAFSGTYPSLGSGEPLVGKIKSVAIGHGLFSLLDAFPFQFGCTPPSADGPGVCDPATSPYSVSIPASERAFGQGAIGSFSNFRVLTIG